MLKIKNPLTLDNIHNYLQQELIWSHILGISIKSKFSLRENDTIPSCSWWFGSSGDLLLQDFGNPMFKGKPISWWMYLMKIKYQYEDKPFMCALEEIRRTFNLPLRSYNKFKWKVYKKEIIKVNRVKKTIPTIIKIKYQRKGGRLYYSNKVLDYWKQYGITKEELKAQYVVPVSRFWITKKATYEFYIPNKLVFAYYHGKNKRGIDAYSIYIPEKHKGHKWFKNTDNSILQGERIIDGIGDLLTVQSSLKDTMCMRCMGTKNTVGIDTECSWMIEYKWEDLKERYNNQIYFANNDSHKIDNPGIGYARIHKNNWDIDYIHTPDDTTSDISDYYKEFGELKTRKLINKLYEGI